MKTMEKELKREIKQLNKIIEQQNKEIQLLKNNEKFLKEHAQKAGTEMFHWKKQVAKLETQIEKSKHEIEFLNVKLKSR